MDRGTPALSVAFATHDMVPSMFAYSLSQLVAFTMASIPENVPFGINMVSGTYVHKAREQLLEGLMQQGVTHVLWMDSDMRFPRDAFTRLLQHNLPVTGINYAQRGLPTDYVAIKEIGGSKCSTTSESQGLERVEAMGFGLLLMRLDKLKDVLTEDNKPWFWFEKTEDGRDIGEDVWFFRLLKEAGVECFVDHDLSKECAHIGQYEYELDLVEATKGVERKIITNIQEEQPKLEVVS